MRKIHSIITSISLIFTSSCLLLGLYDFLFFKETNGILQFLLVIIVIEVFDQLLCYFIEFKSWRSYYITELFICLPVALIGGYLSDWYSIYNGKSIVSFIIISFLTYSSVMYFFYSKHKAVADDINNKLTQDQNKEQ